MRSSLRFAIPLSLAFTACGGSQAPSNGGAPLSWTDDRAIVEVTRIGVPEVQRDGRSCSDPKTFTFSATDRTLTATACGQPGPVLTLGDANVADVRATLAQVRAVPSAASCPSSPPVPWFAIAVSDAQRTRTDRYVEVELACPPDTRGAFETAGAAALFDAFERVIPPPAVVWRPESRTATIDGRPAIAPPSPPGTCAGDRLSFDLPTKTLLHAQCQGGALQPPASVVLGDADVAAVVARLSALRVVANDTMCLSSQPYLALTVTTTDGVPTSYAAGHASCDEVGLPLVDDAALNALYAELGTRAP